MSTSRNHMKDNLAAALDFLEHYHISHTEDVITRLRGEKTDVYIVSDPKWRSRFRDLAAPELDGGTTEKIS